ncbi:MAG: hypothetical protein ACREO4_09450 [Lysobacter sp.]
MADTKRLLLLKAICDYLLSEITVDNGYEFTLASVRRGKKNFGKELKLPAVAVLENFNPDRLPDEIGGVVGTKQKYDQIFLLNGWCDDTDLGPGDQEGDAAHRLMGDVKKALGKLLVPRNQSGFFDGLATTLHIEPGVVRPPDEQSEKAYFWLRIRLEVVEKVGDPYWIAD